MELSEQQMRERLVDLGNQRLLPQATVNYLTMLRDRGIYPKVIYDIGACVLHWTNEAVRIWPESEYYVFEAMPETEFMYLDKPHIKGHHNGVLSDANGKLVSFYQNTYHPGGNSYYRENIEVNPQAEEYFNESHKKVYATSSLDMVRIDKKFPLPDLIKMDVQGAELDVIKGGMHCIMQASHLILELQSVEYNKGAPLKQTVIDYLFDCGFKLAGDQPFHNAGPDGDYHFYNFVKHSM